MKVDMRLSWVTDRRQLGRIVSTSRSEAMPNPRYGPNWTPFAPSSPHYIRIDVRACEAQSSNPAMTRLFSKLWPPRWRLLQRAYGLKTFVHGGQVLAALGMRCLARARTAPPSEAPC